MTTWTGTAPTFAAGVNTGNVTRLNTLRDAVKAASEAWTSYTPAATNFTVGDGTLVGRYARVGKLVLLRVNFTAGASSLYTVSQMQVSLPAAAHGTSQQMIGARVDGASRSIAQMAIVAGASVGVLEVGAALDAMTSATPNPGTTGSLVIEGLYETA